MGCRAWRFSKNGLLPGVVHEHESVPFLMDGSYRAATTLRP